MRYELMLPHQIATAIDKGWPVVLPLGVLEYHGRHLAVGMDTLAVTRILDRLESEIDMVILPPFYYGASSYAVAGPEKKGSVHVDGEKLATFAKSLFLGLLRVGFRNIHFFIHHQTENFAQGMPTDLSFKFGARQAIFEFLEKERGEGWWGDEAMAKFYADRADAADPFSWIRGHALMDEAIISQFPFDHAGEGETSLMMELCPEGVDMSRASSGEWYTATATTATREKGAAGVALIKERLRAILRPTKSNTSGTISALGEKE